MRKPAATLTFVLVASAMMAQDANVADATWRHRDCRYGKSDRAVRRTIRCAADHHRPPGGVEKALDIARKESGFECRADNPDSTALGVYQVLVDTWDGFHRRLKNRWWHRRFELSHNRANCRANVLVSIRIASASGWGPWSLTR